jgi:hypothetical protein
MKWTVAQERSLFDNAHLGARQCRDIILADFDVWRTVEATRRHAYRIGVSMAEWGICSNCGHGAQINATSGFCPLCDTRRKIEREMRYSEELDRLTKEANRKLSSIRRSNSRASKRLGISRKVLSQICHFAGQRG